MGKVKYQKRIQSASVSKIGKHASSISKEVFKNASSSENKKELKSDRHFQRRPAVTPNDLLFEEKVLLALKKVLQKTPVDREQDDHCFAKPAKPAPSKRVRKRNLARKKLAGAFGNMDSLVNALPSVEEKKKISCKPVQAKHRLSKSLKAQEIEMMDDIQMYSEIVLNPSFQTDPFAAAAASIQLRLENEQKESS